MPVFALPMTYFALCLPFPHLAVQELEEFNMADTDESDTDVSDTDMPPPAPVSPAQLKRVSVVLVDCCKHRQGGKDEDNNQDGGQPEIGKRAHIHFLLIIYLMPCKNVVSFTYTYSHI